jgi:hypothetical protein
MMIATTMTKRLVLCTLPLLATMALYSGVLRLPFYSDDIEFYTYLATITPQEIITRADANGLYWRPVPQALYYVLPRHALTWHFIVLMTHLVAVALTGAVARRLGMGWLGAGAAMAFYGLFPFHVQSVAWVLSWGHVLSTTLLLAAVWAWLGVLAGCRCAHRWLALGVLVGCIAPFTHENGVLAAPLLMLVTVFAARRRAIPPAALAALGLVAGVSAFYWLYRGQLVAGRGLLEGDVLERLSVYFAYFLQGLSFPAQLLMNALQGDAVTRIWLGAAVFLALGGVLVWRAHRVWRGTGLLLLAWWVLACLPTVLALPASYNIRYDERLLTVTAPPAMLLLALLITLLPRLRWAALIASGGCMALVAGLYVQLFTLMGGGWQQMFALARQAQPDERVLVVNMPRFMEYSAPVLPMMQPNAMMMQIEFPLRDILWTNTALNLENWRGVADVAALQDQAFPFSLDVWNHYIGYGDFVTGGDLIRYIRQSDQVLRYRVENGLYVVDDVGRRSVPASLLLGYFGDTVMLTRLRETADGQGVTLTWSLAQPADETLVAFVHRLCGETLAAQSDQVPLGGLYGFEHWQEDETWEETRPLPAPEGCQTYRVGVYRASDGQPLLTSQGEPYALISLSDDGGGR